MALPRALLSSVTALGHGAKIHGGIRNAWHSTAGYHPRTRCRQIAFLGQYGGGEQCNCQRCRGRACHDQAHNMTTFRESNYWLTTASIPKGTAGELPASADVGVIGAGFTGLSAARTLAK